MSSTGLGKGLSALLGDEIEKSKEDKIKNISISKIVRNKNQPRKNFDEESLIELSNSIKINGLIQPIIVRPIENEKYEIVAGERRYKAVELIGEKSISAIIVDIEEEEMDKIALIENIQREDLNPIEEAEGFENILNKYKLTQTELSNTIGKSRSYISNSIRLLNLSDKGKKLLSENKISPGHGKVILSIKDKELQEKIIDKIINKELSVRQTEELIKKINNKKQEKKKDELDLSTDYSHIKEIQEKFIETLGTRVNIIENKDNNNKIEIEYYSEEDLQRIYDIIIG